MSVIGYSVSPFLDKLIIRRKTKNIKIGTLGSDDNILINQFTVSQFSNYSKTR